MCVVCVPAADPAAAIADALSNAAYANAAVRGHVSLRTATTTASTIPAAATNGSIQTISHIRR